MATSLRMIGTVLVSAGLTGLLLLLPMGSTARSPRSDEPPVLGPVLGAESIPIAAAQVDNPPEGAADEGSSTIAEEWSEETEAWPEDEEPDAEAMQWDDADDQDGESEGWSDEAQDWAEDAEAAPDQDDEQSEADDGREAAIPTMPM
jgi:hypothetical protein